MHLDSVLHLMPRDGAPSPLYVYLHGAGASALAMVQVADRFAQTYPQAAHLIPDGFVAEDAAPGMRGWFPDEAGDASGLAERVAASLPARMLPQSLWMKSRSGSAGCHCSIVPCCQFHANELASGSNCRRSSSRIRPMVTGSSWRGGRSLNAASWASISRPEALHGDFS